MSSLYIFFVGAVDRKIVTGTSGELNLEPCHEYQIQVREPNSQPKCSGGGGSQGPCVIL